MPFIKEFLIFCPQNMVNDFSAIEGARVIDEESILADYKSIIESSNDHAVTNLLLRIGVIQSEYVNQHFIMSDDDYRPLVHIDPEYYLSEGKYNSFYFYDTKKWMSWAPKRKLLKMTDSYSDAQFNCYQLLKKHKMPTLQYSSHMPQIINRDIFREMSDYFMADILEIKKLEEWNLYFNYAQKFHSDKFHSPQVFRTMCWPQDPSHWPWHVVPERFDFENYYSSNYTERGYFNQLSTKYDPKTHWQDTLEKVRRYSARVEEFRQQQKFIAKISRKTLQLTKWSLVQGSVYKLGVKRLNKIKPGNVYVAGLLSWPTGLSEAAKLLFETLEKTFPDKKINQCDVAGYFYNQSYPWGEKEQPDSDGGTLILCLNPPQGVQYLSKIKFSKFRNKKVIGYWWWELDSFPEDWKRYIKWFDEVWVSSEYIFDILSKHLTIPIKLVKLDLLLQKPKADIEVSEFKNNNVVKVLTVFNLGSSLARKNPEALIKVFQSVSKNSNQSCHLTLKVGSVSHYPGRHEKLMALVEECPDTSVISDSLSDTELDTLIASHDIYASFHRAEGLGLLPAKAMLMGKAVIATGWSGNLEYMTENTAELVSYKLVPCEDPFGQYHDLNTKWADIDYEDAIVKLKQLIEDTNYRHSLGNKARVHIEQLSISINKSNKDLL